MIDTIDAECFGALGDQPLVVIDLAGDCSRERASVLAGATGAILVGVDRTGLTPDVEADDYDVLLTTAKGPPSPWVGIARERLDGRLAGITQAVSGAPIAATTTMRVLRMQGRLSFDDALIVESLAYSVLLGGTEFRNWRRHRPRTVMPAPDNEVIRFEREDDLVSITLARSATRNGLCAAMRDALYAALGAVLDDPTAPRMRLAGAGACFSTGGVLDEFGTADDLALAHAVRSQRSCARLLHRLGERAEALLHSACVGSGIEIPAAAATRIARPDMFVQLPELSMGLMPGAGGTVTIPRAVGRHRAAYMMLSGKRIDAVTALDWKLVHRIEQAP